MTEEEYRKSVEDSQRAAHEETMWGKPARDIITGISNNSNVRPVRAIWELVQNARDVVKTGGRAKIKFTRKEGEVIFQHDGVPFTHKTIEALILQTSSKATENNVEVGQYGTGFLTTHKFGLKFRLIAPLKTTEKIERYYKIQDFDIDRHWTEKADMRAAIENQWLETQKWGKNLNETTEEPYPYTVFRYEHETERAKQNAAEAFKDAPCMVPYVLLLNPQIESIEFIDETEGCHVVYEMPQCQPEKVEELTDGVVYRNIVTKSSSIEGNKQLWMYYIESKEKTAQAPDISKMVVVLPVKEKNGKLHVFQFQQDLPQVYIYLPLLGTEQWGFNYLLHSSLFTCDRDSRDSLRLIGNGQNNDYQAEENRNLIELANKLIWQYIQKNIGNLADAKYLVQVNFKTQQSDEELSEYYKGLQKLWRERYETLQIVSTGEQVLRNIRDVFVLDEVLCQACKGKPALLDALYQLLGRVKKWVVPVKDDMLYWSETINQWYQEEDNPRRLRIDDLVAIASTLEVNEDDLDWLHDICQYLIESKREDLFNATDIKLIPNDKLELQPRDVLKNPVAMAKVVRETLEVMAPEEVVNFVHSKFTDMVNNKVFGYVDIKESISNYMNSHNNDQNGVRSEMMRQRQTDLERAEGQKQFDGEKYLDKGYKDGVVQCMLNMLKSLLPEDTGAFGGKVLPLFEEFYGLEAKIEEGRLDKMYGLEDRAFYNAMIYDTLFKFTVSDGKDDKADWIKKMVETIYGYSDTKPFLANYQVYPDQMGEYKYAEWLKKQPDDTPDRALEIYDEIKWKVSKRSVKAELVDKSYNGFFQGSGVYNSIESCKEIEDDLLRLHYSLDGYEHKNLIVEIIRHLTAAGAESENWKRLFSDINSNKGQLMFSTLVDQSKKDSLFSLIEIEDANRLKLIAELANEPKLERLYDLGKKALLIEEREASDKNFKLDLGKFVEIILRDELNQQLEGVTLTVKPVEDEQGGQDMVLRVNGVVLYYIEVKSRWSSDKSVLMSTSQHRRSYLEKEHYALCAVDMVGTDKEDVKTHNYPPFSEVESRIDVLMNIGMLNERLKDATEDSQGKVHVNGGYQVLVSQDVIKANSVPFSVFVNELKKRVLDYLKG